MDQAEIPTNPWVWAHAGACMRAACSIQKSIYAIPADGGGGAEHASREGVKTAHFDGNDAGEYGIFVSRLCMSTCGVRESVCMYVYLHACMHACKYVTLSVYICVDVSGNT